MPENPFTNLDDLYAEIPVLKAVRSESGKRDYVQTTALLSIARSLESIASSLAPTPAPRGPVLPMEGPSLDELRAALEAGGEHMAAGMLQGFATESAARMERTEAAAANVWSDLAPAEKPKKGKKAKKGLAARLAEKAAELEAEPYLAEDTVSLFLEGDDDEDDEDELEGDDDAEGEGFDV